MMTEFGIWRVDPSNSCDIQSEDGRKEIACTHPSVLRGGYCDPTTAAAYARLIAAAPELLEALRPFGDLVSTVEKTFPNDPVSAGEVCRGSVSFRDFQDAAAAIAKALGTES